MGVNVSGGRASLFTALLLGAACSDGGGAVLPIDGGTETSDARPGLDVDTGPATALNDAASDRDQGACPSREPMIDWSLNPSAARLSGTVRAHEIDAGGAVRLVLTDDQNVPHELVLRIPWRAPLAVGDVVDVTIVEQRSFVIYRTLEVRRQGAVVVYLTDIRQPSLPPPLRLETGDVACSVTNSSEAVRYNRVLAYDGDQPVVIGFGEQADVAGFRVLNDSTITYSPNVVVEDGTDTLGVAVVSLH